MYEFYVCSHYVPEVQYTLSADTILTGQGKTRLLHLCINLYVIHTVTLAYIISHFCEISCTSIGPLI
jgi:hypothetical protein